MSEKNPYMKKPDTGFEDVEELSREEAGEQAEQLREALEYHNYRYYVRNRPVISDAAYDKLFHRLEEIEQEYPGLKTPESPTGRVGAEPVDSLEKVDHTEAMLSLNSSLEEKEIKNFLDFIERKSGDREARYVLEPKFDGLSVEIVYRDGKFDHGATRGNGETGEDISENLKTIGTVPMRLRDRKREVPEFLAVRGEVLMSREGFQKMNRERVEKGQDPFANPRNAAAGTMRQLDSGRVAGRPLQVFYYDILKIEGESPQTHSGILEALREWGFLVNEHFRKAGGMEDIRDYRESMMDKRDQLDFEIDGVVIKLDDLDLREEIGVRERSPRYSMAWKFPPEKEVTTLREIVLSVGRTGILTPVALLDPVEVGGVTVSRASLHNASEVRKKDVRPGDRVRVERAGDVIPEISERVKQPGRKRAGPFSMPDKCPVCGAEVVKEGAYYLCPAGLSCRAQLAGRLRHYGSPDAMDVETLGEKVSEQLVENDMVSDLPDLYGLEKDDPKELEGFAEKSAEKLYNNIRDSRNPRLDRFLYGLGIRHVGEHIARVLAREFGSLENVRDARKKRLEEIGEIGPEIAESIHHFFREERNIKSLERFSEAGVEVREMKTGRKELPLAGKTFVFTGELESFTRSEAKKKVESLGGRATSSVSSKTDYLVAGSGPGSKLDDAEEEGVEILDEQDFLSMINE
ncbi:MAG: NAD-dependent DNA ligase LigA [Candidatus Krumholzibacteriales bacterium]